MENNNTTAIIILVLSILAVFFLGWLIARLMNNIATEDIDLSDEIAKKETELETCQKQNTEISEKMLAKVIVEVPNVITTSAPIINTTSENSRKEDLKIVEGIGPKIEELFHNSGILTYFHLANITVEKLKEILQLAGPRYQMHDPTTWPKQADLANKGMWNELKMLQDELIKGKFN